MTAETGADGRKKGEWHRRKSSVIYRQNDQRRRERGGSFVFL